MRVAALDLGTNTFILLIADVVNGRIERVLHDEVRVIRLGQGVHEHRKFHPEALARAEACFAGFHQVIQRHSVDRVLACATSAARDVSNREELFAIGKKYEIPIQVITGEMEAEFTFNGTVGDDLTQPVVIVDVGGGSTEFILGDETGMKVRKSIDIGAVRMTEMFVSQHPIPLGEMARMKTHIDEKLEDIRTLFAGLSPSKLIAVAGTPTTLAAVDLQSTFDPERIDGYRLSLAKIQGWVDRFAAMTVEERQRLAGMEPKRADVIVAGSLILLLSCQAFRVQDIEVSIRGLRYGVARFLESQGEGEPLASSPSSSPTQPKGK